MFGYIKPFKPDLRFCEYDIYKASYCTLCKYLGKNFGIISRLFLNYDFAFLALACLAVGEDQPEITDGRCGCNPLKKCKYCSGREEVFDTLSGVVVISVYNNLTDDIEDLPKIKALPKLLLRLLLKRAYKKAKSFCPQIDDITQSLMESQREIERKKCASIDEAAHPSSIYLSRLAQKICSPQMADIGYYLGRWIYLIDCADDLQKDINTGEYNPLKLRFLLDGRNAGSMDEAYDYISEAISRTQVKLCYEFDALKFRRYDQIIGNVIFEGLVFEQKRVFREIAKRRLKSGKDVNK